MGFPPPCPWKGFGPLGPCGGGGAPLEAIAGASTAKTAKNNANIPKTFILKLMSLKMFCDLLYPCGEMT